MPTHTMPLCYACISVTLGCRLCFSSIHKAHKHFVSPKGGYRAETARKDSGVIGLQGSGDKGQNTNCAHQQHEEFQLLHHSSLLGGLSLQLLPSGGSYQHKMKILRAVTGSEGKTKHWQWMLAHGKPQMLFRICASHL